MSTVAPRGYPLTLKINAEAYDVLLAYVRALDVEINGFAYVTKVSNRVFVIEKADDIIITQQTVSHGSAVSDAVGNAIAYQQAAMCGRDDDLRVQWHSHVDGPARFSITDINTMDANERAGMIWGISLVLNKRGEFEARFDLYQPIRTFQMMEVQIIHVVDPMLEARVRAEIAEKVTIARPQIIPAKVEAARPAHRRRRWPRDPMLEFDDNGDELDDVDDDERDGDPDPDDFTPLLSLEDFADVFGNGPEVIDRIKYSGAFAEAFFATVHPFDTEFSTTQERQ